MIKQIKRCPACDTVINYDYGCPYGKSGCPECHQRLVRWVRANLQVDQKQPPAPKGKAVKKKSRWCCRKCKTKVRDTRTRKCVECTRRKQERIDTMLASGNTTYHGKPCKKHGHTLRTIKTNACVLCRRERARLSRESNPERYKAQQKRYVKAHPAKVRQTKYQYRMSRKQAEGSFTDDEWLVLCEGHNHRCACCGKKKKLTIDHIVPLSKGGTNYISNIQPLCKSCNSRKGAKTIKYSSRLPPCQALP